MASPSEKFVISNYDVLADEISNPISLDECDVGLSLAAHSYHVGNNRLEVMCNIHYRSYTDFQAKGDEAKCAEILDKIMDIVQNQCEPNGRFLERNNKGEWKKVEPDKARKLVRQALSHVQNQPSGDSTAGHAAVDLKKQQEDDAEKKRRRRSSLLRRSVSSSMLPNLMEAGTELNSKFDDKKKATRLDRSPLPSPANSRATSPVPAARPVFGRSQSVELGGARQGRRLATVYRAPKITETLPMDVLFNTAKTALLPGTDLHGNNRMRVMVTIQTGTYSQANEEEQTKMAEDLIKTVESFWGGRILSKVPSLTRKGDEDEYVKLDRDHATSAMKNLLSGKAFDREDEITIGEAHESNVKQGRRASLQAIQAIAAIEGGDVSITPSSIPPLPTDMQQLRSAAVKSLQKRKQRQGLNSRIRGLTADKAAVFQDGSSNASVVSGASENTSPVPTKIISNLPNIPTTLHPGLRSPTSQHRQGSSGASVASTASNTSSYPHQSYALAPGIVQRQGSVDNMSTSSSNTTRSRTTNAARTMANMHLGGPPQGQVMEYPDMMQHAAGIGGNALGSEQQNPYNVMLNQQMQNQMAQQMMAQQMMAQQMYQQHQAQLQTQLQTRVSVMMPTVLEEFGNAQNEAYSQYGSYGAAPLLMQDQLAQLTQGLHGEGTFDPNFQTGRTGDRNSLLNSTGSDGLPQFQTGEMELLIKGLEMAENQNRGF